MISFWSGSTSPHGWAPAEACSFCSTVGHTTSPPTPPLLPLPPLPPPPPPPLVAVAARAAEFVVLLAIARRAAAHRPAAVADAESPCQLQQQHLQLPRSEPCGACGAEPGCKREANINMLAGVMMEVHVENLSYQSRLQ